MYPRDSITTVCCFECTSGADVAALVYWSSLMRDMMQEKRCFVIGPIGERKSDVRVHADILLDKIIRPTFDQHFKEFKVIRADRIAQPGIIHNQVITLLIEAELVVADLTSRNANAFYELGIRHLLQKPIIHMYRHGDKVPLDVSSYRAIAFSYEDRRDIRDAKIALRDMVTESLQPTAMMDNPVTRSTGFMRMEEANAQNVPRKKQAKPSESSGSSGKFRPGNEPYIADAPGLTWKIVKAGWMASWTAPLDAVRKGWRPRDFRLWAGTMEELDKYAIAFISERCNDLQKELHAWQEKTGIYAR